MTELLKTAFQNILKINFYILRILVVVLKRLMVRGRNECVAAQLVKHGEQKKMHVIQKVSVLQRAKVRYIIVHRTDGPSATVHESRTDYEIDNRISY